MLETAIADYHAALQDEALARATWEALTVGQRERNLFFGDRPLATVMRPRFLTRPQYDLLRRGVGLVVAALQRLGDALLADPALRARIALTPQEEALLARDPGYPYHSAHSRMDTFLTLMAHRSSLLNTTAKVRRQSPMKMCLQNCSSPCQ